MRDRLQDIRADGWLARAPPHHGKQVRQLPEVVDLLQLPDRRSHSRPPSGVVAIPASSIARRTAAATCPAPGVSPCTQIVSNLPVRASATACSAADAASSTAP